VCRQLDDPKLFADRCRDTAKDDRGYIITLTDEELGTLVEQKKKNPTDFPLIRSKFNALTD